MNSFRWWLFKRLSALGWIICPEPHRTNLQRATVSWQEYAKYLDIEADSSARTKGE